MSNQLCYQTLSPFYSALITYRFFKTIPSATDGAERQREYAEDCGHQRGPHFHERQRRLSLRACLSGQRRVPSPLFPLCSHFYFI